MYEKSYISYVTKNQSHMRVVYDLQQLAYQVEAKLISYPDLPPLKESVHDLMSSEIKYRACQINLKAQGVRDIGVIAYEDKNDIIYIHKVIVHPEFFHGGIATFLLDNIIQENPQCKTFHVSTAKKNIPACKLYEKSGFVFEKEIEKPGITLVEYEKKSINSRLFICGYDFIQEVSLRCNFGFIRVNRIIPIKNPRVYKTISPKSKIPRCVRNCSPSTLKEQIRKVSKIHLFLNVIKETTIGKGINSTIFTIIW